MACNLVLSHTNQHTSYISFHHHNRLHVQLSDYLYLATLMLRNQQEQTTMVWPCHEERGKVKAEGCNDVKDEGKETERKTKTKVAR